MLPPVFVCFIYIPSESSSHINRIRKRLHPSAPSSPDSHQFPHGPPYSPGYSGPPWRLPAAPMGKMVPYCSPLPWRSPNSPGQLRAGLAATGRLQGGRGYIRLISPLWRVEIQKTRKAGQNQAGFFYLYFQCQGDSTKCTVSSQSAR